MRREYKPLFTVIVLPANLNLEGTLAILVYRSLSRSQSGNFQGSLKLSNQRFGICGEQVQSPAASPCSTPNFFVVTDMALRLFNIQRLGYAAIITYVVRSL